MAEAASAGSSETEDGSKVPFVCGQRSSYSDSSMPNGFVTKENIENWEPGRCSPCSSAKQYRKMSSVSEEISFTYTWEQTDSDVAVTVRLKGFSDEQTRALNVTFTSTEVNIGLSEDKSHTIKLYQAIQKDKSRVQAELKKGSITLLVVKQQRGLWPTLEAPTETMDAVDVLEQDGAEVCDNKDSNDTTIGAALDQSEQNEELAGTESSSGKDNKENLKVELVEKEEEPVYPLTLVKHNFFERDDMFTACIYVKSLDKDSVKVTFSKQGFVLKFHTGDAKFLQLYEGTTTETTFTWPVTTRQEIIPDDCRFKVKSATVEITLRKTSNDRWATLEAPMRKADNASNSKSDTWLPISKSTPTTANSTASASPATSTLAAAAAEHIPAADSLNKAKSSKVIFDEDLSDIDLNDKGSSSKFFSTSRDSRLDDDFEAGSSILGENFKLRSNMSQDLNKPTARVHPLNNQASEAVIPPGFAGLVNLGNTCFMNCVLQVLANTREFRDYFLDGRFQDEINCDNPLGMKGLLAATFGTLLRWLWSCRKHCWEPRKLKDLISKKNPQFFGYAQHDAHEFLAFLLDGLHEDLNRIKKKRYTETVDSDGRPDEVVAAEAWALYKQRNDSVVVDIFQGQYKSKLVCPKCGKVSITFDPFLYLSVPLPKKKKIIPVIFMWKESYKKPVRYQVHVPQDATLSALLEELATRTKVKACDMRAFEAYKGRIHKFFLREDSLARVEQKDIVIVCEVLSADLAGEEVLEIPVMQRTLFPSEYPVRCAFCHKPCGEGPALKRCTKCYKVGYCDHTCQRSHWNVHRMQCNTSPEPIGCPFILSVPASRATYGYLVKHMEEYSRFSVDIFQPPVKSAEGGGGGGIKHSGPSPQSNLNSSLSQSCSSLNSLDSLSSASSTCTLTGDQSDPQTQEGGEESGEAAGPSLTDSDTFVPQTANSPLLPPSSPQTPSGSENLTFAETVDNIRPVSVDSGFESLASKSQEKAVPMSQVMGIQAAEAERDKATPTFFIKPVTLEGMGIKGAERLDDRGDQPLNLTSRKFLSMDWRNNERQPFYVLVQSKDLEAEEMDNLNNMAASGSNKPTLQECLELFTEPEVLSPEEAWYCPRCKKHVEASKQMDIWRLPHTLIIQLKRFSFQNFLMRSKIKKHVEFPTRGLDMSQYCVGLKPGEPAPIYDLYGVANHHGLLIGGHYTSYVRCAGVGQGDTDGVGWRLCDDSRVSPISNEKSVVTADAYLLFYRRRDMQATIRHICSSSESHPEARKEYSGIIDSEQIISNEEDERNGNLAQQSQNINNRIKESVNNKLLSDSYEGEDSDRTNNENRNRQNISRGKEIPYGEPKTLISQYENEVNTADVGQDSEEEEESMEKGDREKDFFDCDIPKDREFIHNYEYNIGEDDDDDDGEERSLVIDTQPDLGYTDMDAVD